MLIFALLFWVVPAHAHDAHQGQFDLSRIRPDVIEFVQERVAQRGAPRRYQNSEELRLQSWVDEFIKVPANQHYFKGIEFKVWIDPAHYANATAAPNGEIKVTQGLLDSFGTRQPQYVQAIIAHELAHVARAHAMQRVSGAVGTQSIAKFSTRSCTSFLSCKGVFEFLDSRELSRAFEIEADHIALELMNNAKMDPALFAVALQALETPRIELRPEPKRGPVRSFLRAKLKGIVMACSTHPETCDRVASIFSEIQEHRYEHAWSEVPKPPTTTLKWLSELAKRVKI